MSSSPLRASETEHRVMFPRPSPLDEFFGRRQRNHLPGDLGETFGAAHNPDKAVVIDMHDITSVIPARSPLGCRPRDLSGAEIPEHDMWPGSAQAPALIDARHGLDVALHSGQQPAYTARPVLHRRIH